MRSAARLRRPPPAASGAAWQRRRVRAAAAAQLPGRHRAAALQREASQPTSPTKQESSTSRVRQDVKQASSTARSLPPGPLRRSGRSLRSSTRQRDSTPAAPRRRSASAGSLWQDAAASSASSSGSSARGATSASKALAAASVCDKASDSLRAAGVACVRRARRAGMRRPCPARGRQPHLTGSAAPLLLTRARTPLAQAAIRPAKSELCGRVSCASESDTSRPAAARGSAALRASAAGSRAHGRPCQRWRGRAHT